jgi:hypothetical protein
MTQPKPSSARSRKKARASKPAQTDENVSRGLFELLTRAVMLPTELLREAVDDAVRRGRLTRSDAEDLIQSLIAIGRRQTEDMIADVEQMLGRPRRTQQGADHVAREADRARRMAGLGGGFPISGYDELAAAQIIARLDGLTPADLRKVRDYERKHGNRKTVLSAIERKLG